MAHESQLDGYTRQALAAEQERDRAATAEARMAWEQIAVGYLELADLTRREALKQRA